MAGLAPLPVRVLTLVLLPVIAIVAAVLGVLSTPVVRTRREVAAILERRIAGEESDAEWDDFICVPIADPELEALRREIVRREETNGLGFEWLRTRIAGLRVHEQAVTVLREP